MKKVVLVLSLALFLLSACAPKDSAPLSPGVDLDAILTTSTPYPAISVNEVQATSTPVVGGILLENDVCDNPYYPVVDGAWWQYNISTGSTPMHTMAANEDKTFTITVNGEEVTFTFDGSCTDDGIILLEVPGVSATAQSSDGSSSITTTNDDGVTLPNDVQVGDDWSQSISVIANGGAGSLSAHIDTNYKAVGYEIVGTPYGPINALKVEQTGSLSMDGGLVFDIHGYIWYGQGIGVIKNTIDGSFEATISAYNIPQP